MGVTDHGGNLLAAADFTHQLVLDKFVVVGEGVHVQPTFGDREAGQAGDCFEDDADARCGSAGIVEHDGHPGAVLGWLTKVIYVLVDGVMQLTVG
jgi:hypothetical protein